MSFAWTAKAGGDSETPPLLSTRTTVTGAVGVSSGRATLLAATVKSSCEGVEPGQQPVAEEDAQRASSSAPATTTATAITAPAAGAASSSENGGVWPASPAVPSAARVGEDKRAEADSVRSAWGFLWPRLALLGVAAIWGTNFASVKFIGDVDALNLSTGAFARFLVAALALAPVTARALWRARHDLAFLAKSARLGAVVFAGYYVQAVGLADTTANKSAFMCSLTVVLVPFMERVLGKRIEARAWLSAFIAIAGVGVLELDDATVTSLGDLWSFGQAVFFGAGFMMLERLTREYPGRQLDIASLNLTTIALGSGVWWLLASSGGGVAADALRQVACIVSNSAALSAIAYTGLVTTALAVLMQTFALSRVSAEETSVIFCTEPLWAMAFSAVLLGENMSVKGGVGGALTIAAVLINQIMNPEMRARLLGKRHE